MRVVVFPGIRPRGGLGVVWIVVGLVGCMAGGAKGQEFSDQAVESAITRGVKHLWSQQQKDGSWKTDGAHGQKKWVVGPTAIVAYALLESGVMPNDKRMAKTMEFLRKTETDATYGLAFRALAYGAALRHDRSYGPLLRDDVRQLILSMDRYGGYTYTSRGSGPRREDYNDFVGWAADQSNTQYGLLGVWAGAMQDMEVPMAFWQRSLDYWRRHQKDDGGWGYSIKGRANPYMPMTLAGLASVFVCYDSLYSLRFINCGGNARFPAAEKALAWVEKRINDIYRESDAFYYTLYGVERVGLATGYKFLGRHDWYKRGAVEILRRQEGDGSWKKPGGAHSGGTNVMTAYALLFLVRGRRPVLFNRLEFDGDWNNRPRALANLTWWLSKALERDVHWQVINLKVPVEEWHDAPILCLSGSKEINLSDDDIDKIRTFVHQGGTILSVTECNGGSFATKIREVYKRLFGRYELTQLPPDHPLYNVYHRLPPALRLYEVSNGVRPLAIHTEDDLTAAWQGRRYLSDTALYNVAVNVVAYTNDTGALSGELRFRGTSLWPRAYVGKIDRTLRLARLKHAGNYDPEPLAMKRFRRLLAQRRQVALEVVGPVGIEELLPTGAKLATMTGTGRLVLGPPEREALRRWIEGGGTLLIDAAGGDRTFAESAETVLTEMFGARALRMLSVLSPLYRMKGMEIVQAHYRRRTRLALGNRKEPNLQVVLLGERPAVYLSREDITAGLVGYPSYTVDGYSPETAYEIMRNIVFQAAGPGGPVSQPQAGRTARASVNNTEAHLAIDGKRETRWSTDRPMKKGDWFTLDLGQLSRVRGLVLDSGASPEDHPRGYEVHVSVDGKDWGKPAATGKGAKSMTLITLDKPADGRYVKIVQTGSHKTNFWSIHEVMVQTD